MMSDVHRGNGRQKHGELLLELGRAQERITQLERQCPSPQMPWADSLVQHLRDGFALLSPEGVHLEVNPALCAMVGYSREELIGTGIPHPYWPPTEGKRLARILRRHLGGAETTIEVIFCRRNGERFPALVTPSTVCDAAGEPLCLLATVKDVSEQRRSEEQLRESEARYRAMFEENRAIKLLIDPRSGTIVDASPSAADFYGYSREQLQALQVTDISTLPPDEVFKGMARACREGLAGFVCQHRLASGELRDVEVNSGPIAVAGRTLLFSVVQDVTERQRSETALRESEVRYRSVVENAPVGIFQSTPEGQLLHVNPAVAQMLGFATPAEMIAVVNRSGLAEALYPDARERRQLLEDARQAGGEWISFKAHLRHRDGGVRTVQFYACERRDPLSGQPGLYGFIQDITAQEAASTALARSMQLLRSGERLAHVGSWELDVAAGTSVVSEEWQRMHGLEGALQSNAAVEATCHPDDREAVRQALTAATGGDTYRVEHRIVHPATRGVRHLSTHGDPVFDAEGRLERILGASLDVTERVRADAVLLEREERLKGTLEATVAALGTTVAMRDPYTASHERRVAELACAIASSLGWSEEAVARLRTAALVHDIGKITVPAELLAKPTRLTETEFALIKVHAQAAYDILAPIDFGGPVAEIVQQHHERLDGSGYPRGLAGEEILPGARLLAVSDVVEAMVSHRPYRAALPLEAALAEIESGAGVRYDTAAVAACRALFAEGFAFTQ